MTTPRTMSNLIVDARLTEPPSEVSVFRDVSMYASVFLDLSVLVQCPRRDVDLYWYWLRNRGAFDFVDDIVQPDQESGILLSCLRGNIAVNDLKAETLNFVIHQLIRIAG